MENKTGKYFKYAIGEIVLVVIGILIALQINNWNENRKNTIKIKESLRALKYDLIKDSTLIRHHLNHTDKELLLINSAVERTRSYSSTIDTLINIANKGFTYYWVTPLKFSNSTLKNIQDSGLFENLSDSLRLGITDLDNTQVYYLKNLENFNNLYKAKLNNFTQNYTISITGNNANFLARKMSWKNINNKDFVIKFDDLIVNRQVLWKQYEDLLVKSKNRTNQLINLIDKELDK